MASTCPSNERLLSYQPNTPSRAIRKQTIYADESCTKVRMATEWAETGISLANSLCLKIVKKQEVTR